MAVLTVTTEGELTLTEDVLKPLGIHPGDKIDVVGRPGGKLELSAVKSQKVGTPAAEKRGGLEAFFGSIKNEHDVHLTLDEIEEEIKKAWAGEK